jgi:hypothetical protein
MLKGAVMMRNIRPGDTVTLKVVVSKIYNTENMFLGSDGRSYSIAMVVDIEAREFQVGDKVYIKPKGNTAVIKGLDENIAWVRYANPSVIGRTYESFHVSDLEHES